MGYSRMSGSAALPKPTNTPSPTVSDFGGSFENIGGAYGETQVVAHGPNLINWIGQSADAYTHESLDIQSAAMAVQEVLGTISGEYGTYHETFQRLVDVTIPDYQQQWDQAIETHDENVETTEAEMASARAATPPDVVFDDSSFLAEIQRQHENLEETQDELARLYNSAVSTVDDAASTAGGNIVAALETIVTMGEGGAPPNRTSVGNSLFGDNGGILGAQQQLEQASVDAEDAADILSDVDEYGFPTEEALREFNDKYGQRMANDPFFATAFFNEFGVDELNALMGRVGYMNAPMTPEQQEEMEEALGHFGAGLILATGGTNEISDAALSLDGQAGELARYRQSVWDSWNASGMGESFDFDGFDGLDDWRESFQGDMIEAGRNMWDSDGNPNSWDSYAGGTSGYSAMTQIMALAAQDNPNLALGDSFLNGPNSVAHDIVAWNHEANFLWDSNGAMSFRLLPTMGDDGIPADPVLNMLGLMDGTGEPAQTFLNSTTTFDVDHDRDRDTDAIPMEMTRYLVGHKPWLAGTAAWEDNGDALGELLHEATSVDPSSQASANIAYQFIEGYTEGLAFDNDFQWIGDGDQVDGEDKFGHFNSGLRSWAGFILDDYMSDIADGIITPGSSSGVILDPSGDGYKIVLDAELRDQIIGDDRESLFTDLAFDNPEQNEDGTWVGGRPPALNTLIDQSIMEMNADLVYAMEQDDDGMIHEANANWGNVLEQLTTSEADKNTAVGEAYDNRNAYLQSVLKAGYGAIPFSEILETPGQKWAQGQIKNLGLLDAGLEAFLPTDNAAAGQAQQVNDHNAVEVLVREQFYSAVSQNTNWSVGADPVDMFGPGGAYSQYDILDSDGNFIPYSQMTAEEKIAFEQWVTDHEYGAGSRFDEHVQDIEGNLNDAQQEGDE